MLALCLLFTVLLFVGSAAYTLANMRDELTDLLYSGDSLADLGIAGFGLGESTAHSGMHLVAGLHTQRERERVRECESV